MAKSLRSKWKRKMRAVKRVRYGQKELERLKKAVGEDDVKKEIDCIMVDVSDVVTVTDAKSVKHNSKSSKTKPKDEASTSKTNQEEKPMEGEKMDDDTLVHKYNTKTMRDQFGSYPVWMHQRKIGKNKKARKGRPKRK